MISYLLRRLGMMAVTLMVTSILIFALTQLLPGDVAKLVLGRDASPAAVENFNSQYGLDRPPIEQYLRWIGGFLTADWGVSYTAGAPPVRPLVIGRMVNSLILAMATLLFAVPLSLFLGIVSAVREGSWIDQGISITSLAVVGLPEFVTGIVLINAVAVGLGWFSASSMVNEGQGLLEWIRILVLPAITASLVLIGYITRMTRASTIEELKKPYVRTALLKGMTLRQVLMKHVLRNALLPSITIIAISFGWLMGGLVVIENVFNYPGMGSLLVTAVGFKNLPVLQSISMIIVFYFSLANLIADLLYAWLNPRIRLG
jgi:peptide/nickel transport system permease protein